MKLLAGDPVMPRWIMVAMFVLLKIVLGLVLIWPGNPYTAPRFELLFLHVPPFVWALAMLASACLYVIGLHRHQVFRMGATLGVAIWSGWLVGYILSTITLANPLTPTVILGLLAASMFFLFFLGFNVAALLSWEAPRREPE